MLGARVAAKRAPNGTRDTKRRVGARRVDRATRARDAMDDDERRDGRRDDDDDDDDARRRREARSTSINMFRNYELRTAYAATASRTLPITLVVGFLGAGKTTLARRALENRQTLRVAAAVNDFAALNVDARLVRRASGARDGEGKDGRAAARVTELTNGCVCCSLRDDLERGVIELLNADENGGELGVFDYLLIETSGLVDPGEVVSRLDRNFGALTRARLDGVVCVVDAEIASEGGPEVEREAWDAQLACADVVLLNKIDLLEGDEERLARARAVVEDKARGARVLECVDANVPLTSILDVDMVPQPEGKSGHDWGAGPLPYVLSASGGRLRKPKTEAQKIVVRGPLSLDPSRKTTHFAGGSQSSCNSLAHETTSPLVFARFQHWATKMMPAATIRAKGVLTLAEDENRESYDFHFSGKRRLELEPSVGELVSATSTCLVVIGVGLNEEEIMRDIRALEQPLPLSCVAAIPSVKRAMTRAMAKDLRFEIDDSVDEDNALILFRLTGAASNGFTVAELEESHGVDFNAMNLDLLRAVNSSGDGLCLAPTTVPHKLTKFGAPQLWLRLAAVHGFEDSYDDVDALAQARLEDAWSLVRVRATNVLERAISHIPKCKCGF